MNKEDIAMDICFIVEGDSCSGDRKECDTYCTGVPTKYSLIANYIEQNYIHKSEVKTAEVKRLIDNKSYYEALMEIFGNISK